MTKTPTPHDLIRYLFSETGEATFFEIEKLLLNDSSLACFVSDTNTMRIAMDRMQLSPSDETVDRILAFANIKCPK